MDNFQIETAQNITLQQNAAHITTRIGSYLLDALIIVLYIIVLIFVMGWLNIDEGFTLYVFWTIFGLPIFFYSLLFEVLLNGQTPGKIINKLRVVKLDGTKPTFGSYLLRWMLRVIDFNLASGSVAVLTILLNGKGQRLGDIAGGTTVISERKRVTLNTLGVDVATDYKPTFPQVTTLSDSDIQTIKELYRKSKRTRNHKIILKLHVKIIEITNIKTDLQPMDFVELVIKDYNYYTQQ
ncbi:MULTISPECIES: RDD family protein [Tenacibaculum]|uniref:RDD family protein n=1 Tax=Tenacibaculum TaxID=104267 RepID=UPI001F0ABF1E|nr:MULTISPECIES: RDD family protein [Tenacibaculum]MCH3882753.1 RDD family protein [Tenacibaculum aquimarinum]MDO6600210.1 RDD family protein [Tenacibaculum sp. 1_MG-2023]